MTLLKNLLKRYHTLGKAGFIHGNRGNTPATTIPIDVKEKVIHLYHSEYADTNFTYFTEIIKKDLSISISDNTLNKWLREEYTCSPKAKRKTKKTMKKLLSLN